MTENLETTAVEGTEEAVEETPVFDNEEPTEQTEGTEEQSEEPYDWSSLELKHFDEVKKLSDFSPDEVKALTQKGWDYDNKVSKLNETIDSFKNNPAYRYIDDYMKNSGYEDPVQFVKALEVSTLAQQYVEQGKDPETAKELAEAKTEAKYANMQSPRSEMDSKIQDLLAWHSDKLKQGIFDNELTPDSIPNEVIDAIEKGASPKEAFMDYTISNIKSIKTETEQKTIKAIEENKAKSTGSVTQGVEGNDSVLTAKQIDAMLSKMNSKEASKWIDANYDKIEKSGYFKNF